MAQNRTSEDSAPEFDGSNPSTPDVVVFSSSHAKQRSAHEVTDSDQSGDDENGTDVQGQMERTMQNAELNTRSDDDVDDNEEGDGNGQPLPSSSRRNTSDPSNIPSLSIPSSTSTAFLNRQARLELPDSVFAEAATERAASKAQREKNELLERERAAASTPQKRKRKVTHKSEDLISGSRIVRTLSNSSRAEPAPATGSISKLLKIADSKKRFERKSATLVATKQSKGFAPAIGFSSFSR